MKTLISLLAVISILTVNSYGQKSEANALLKKPETRKEIINLILNDHNYMTEFIQDMHGNQHAMMMMNSNNQMIGNKEQMDMNDQNPVPDKSYMMNMMHNNPAMMQMMMGNMMDVVATDTAMSHNMLNMMTNHPQIMQMMRQQINHKGMTGTMGK